jgi:hypothetical protein
MREMGHPDTRHQKSTTRLSCNRSRNREASARIAAELVCECSCCNCATTSAKVRLPSHNSRILRPVACTRIAPSGNSTTRVDPVPPQRHPTASLGLLEFCTLATIHSSIQKAPGGGHPGCTYAKYTASNCAQRMSHLSRSACITRSCSSRDLAFL